MGAPGPEKLFPALLLILSQYTQCGKESSYCSKHPNRIKKQSPTHCQTDKILLRWTPQADIMNILERRCDKRIFNRHLTQSDNF